MYLLAVRLLIEVPDSSRACHCEGLLALNRSLLFEKVKFLTKGVCCRSQLSVYCEAVNLRIFHRRKTTLPIRLLFGVFAG